jgi:hypothetical protein
VNVTDWLFNFISQSVASSEQTTSSKSFNLSSTIIDSNNNSSSDFNNNCYNDVDTNVDQHSSRLVDSRANSKLPTGSPIDTSDLERLLLDLSAPIFSDDDLRSILGTL